MTLAEIDPDPVRVAHPTYLTSMTLRSSCRSSDTQAWHRIVLARTAIPGGVERVLWAMPDPGVLVVRTAQWVNPSVWRDIAEDARAVQEDDSWGPDARVALSLIANPVRAEHVMSTAGGPSRRRPLAASDLEPWLRRKIDCVDLDRVQAQDLGYRTGIRRTGRVTHRLVAYAATGTVTDADTLRGLIRTGVGPSRGYGAGLLITRALS